jgi:hypothetical protein
MNRQLIGVVYFTCCVTIIGCSAVFETNIENKNVTLRAPADSFRTSLATHTFWWNYVEGADKYNLQIVTPGFDRIERLMVDTNISCNKFSFTLKPGNYEWSVSAYNSAYNTPYTVFALFIDSTTDLSNQQIILNIPIENYATRNNLQKFKWYKIYNATGYHFEIRKDSWMGELIENPVDTPADTISVLLTEGNYFWGVKALNETSASLFNVRELTIDVTLPSKPLLLLPATDDTLFKAPVHFTWSRPDMSGSSITDSVYISTDSIQFFENITKSYKTNNTSYDVNPGVNGGYYWRIRSIDAAGNKSEPSEIRKFSLEL